VKVTDALGFVTSFAYDEVGNRIRQTDANNHVTSFEYDRLGRTCQRTRPEGVVESMTYDAAGNLASRTDFNVKTTTYAYSALNQPIQRTPDPTLGQEPIRFSYTSAGQIASLNDANGVTTYEYDTRDRLITKTHPGGSLIY